MSYNHCSTITLPCGLQEFVCLFFEDKQQHISFLESELKETNIDITNWEEVAVEAGEGEGEGEGEGKGSTARSMQRTVSVDHPLPVVEMLWLPWLLPSYVRNSCRQTVSWDPAQPTKLSLRERSVVTAVPIVEPVLCAIWSVEEVTPGQLDISVDLSFNDCNVFLLQGLIEYHASAGLQHYFLSWEPHARSLIQSRRERGISGIQAGEEVKGALGSVFWGTSSTPSS